MQHRNAALFPAIALVLGLTGCGQMINDQVTYATWKQSPPDAAALIAVKPVRNEAGHLVLRRVYRFEFSDDGSRRRAGSVVMLSGEVESLTMEPFLLQ